MLLFCFVLIFSLVPPDLFQLLFLKCSWLFYSAYHIAFFSSWLHLMWIRNPSWILSGWLLYGLYILSLTHTHEKKKLYSDLRSSHFAHLSVTWSLLGLWALLKRWLFAISSKSYQVTSPREVMFHRSAVKMSKNISNSLESLFAEHEFSNTLQLWAFSGQAEGLSQTLKQPVQNYLLCYPIIHCAQTWWQRR